MGILSNILGAFRREASPKGAAPSQGSALSPWPYAGASGPAMRVATVYCCVKLLSESVANLPVLCMKRRGGIFVEDEDSELGYLLNVQPDPAMSAFDFWRQAVQRVLLDGNAYIVPFYELGGPGPRISRLALCGRGTVSHDTMADAYAVSDPLQGISGVFAEGEVIHLKGLSGPDPKRGVSVLEYARMATDIASTADEETRKRFANGGNVRGILSNEGGVRGFGEYADEELDSMAARMNRRFSGGEGIVPAFGRLDFKQLSMTSADMQFLESRKFTVREICRFFGVHPSFVFDDTSNNYKSAEQANAAFLCHTLNPLLRSIEAELLRKLFPESLARKRRITFDRRGLYACDLDSRARYQSARLANGTATVNELRREENLPPVEGGDRVFVSASLKGIDEARGGKASQESNDDNANI